MVPSRAAGARGAGARGAPRRGRGPGAWPPLPRRTSDLAIARRDFGRDVATERLNDLVAAAHALVYSEAPTSGRRLRRFVLRELPATVRANWRFTLLALGILLVPLVVTFLLGVSTPDIAAN